MSNRISTLLRIAAPSIATLTLMVAGLAFASAYWKFVLSLTLANIGVGVALVMLVGYARCITLATGAVLAVGAYAATLGYMKLGAPFPLALLGATIVGALSGIVIAVPGVRFRGHNLALITLVFQAVVMVLLREWREITGGSQGLTVTPPMIFGWRIVTDDAHLLLIGTVIAISILPITLLLQGPFGKNLRALATNEVGASAYGISASNYLIWAFMLSGAVTALAGGVSAPRQRIIDTDSFGLHYSILALAAPVLGGLTSVWGGMVGGSLMRILPEVLRPVSDYIDLIFAALVILTLRYAPGGITDTIARFFDRRGTPKELTAAARMKPPSKVNLTPLVVDVPFENERYPALEVDGVTKRYDALRAVDDASIIVPAGSLFGVIGPNGAGKTTLFNMISGFVTPDTGKIACFGTSIHPGRPEQRIEHGITRTFQNVAIFPTLSCFDNVLIGLGSNTPLNSIARSFDRALRNRRHMEEGLLVDQALAAVGLAAERDLRAGSLSLGDQRRLEIARAIVSRPRLLLLDEPVSGLSADEADALKPLLRGIVRQQGITIFVIEHDVGFLLDLCDSLAVMSSGKVIAQGAPKEVIAEPEVQRIYFGNITAVAHA